MFYLSKQKIVVLFVICLIFSAIEISACVCALSPNENVGDAIKNAVEKSTVVFTGKVIGFEYRKGIPDEYEKDSGNQIEYETMVVKFQVDRRWKGEVPTQIFLVSSRLKYSDGTSRSSSCDYKFKEGESYLVYASGKESELRTNFCAGTKLLNQAEEDLNKLGEGEKPFENKQEMKSGELYRILNDCLNKENFYGRD